MKKTIISICLSSICLFVSSQSFISVPIENTLSPIGGKIYSLPKTNLIVKVKIKQTTKTPGELYPYTESTLGIKDFCTKKEVINEIETITIYPKTIADSSKTYILYNSKRNAAPNCTLNSNNILLSVNKITKLADNKTSKKIISKEQKKDVDFMPSSVYSKEMQQSNSTARIADLAANKIFSLRDARIKLLTQDSENLPSDGEAYNVILKQLNKTEKVYLELFVGHENVQYINKEIEIDPKEGKSIIFRISEKLGVVSNNDLSGSPVYLTITKEKGLVLSNIKESKNKDYSLYYRNPAKAKISIFDSNRTYTEKELTIPQFGTIYTIPTSFNGQISLDEKTGNIISIENSKK